MHMYLIQFSSSNNIVGRTSGSSRRPAVSSSRDAVVGSEYDPHLSRTTDASPGALRGQRSSPVGSSDPKRSSSGRNPASYSKNYETALRGIDSLHFDNDRAHY